MSTETPPTVTPAQGLRAAAAKVREMAAGTTAGPWFTSDCELYPRWIISGGPSEGDSIYATEVARSYHDDDGLQVKDADWRWMAFASPLLAEPLAAWLDACADDADGMAPGAWNTCDEPSSVRHALKVASAINGETASAAQAESLDPDPADIAQMLEGAEERRQRPARPDDLDDIRAWRDRPRASGGAA